MAADFEDIVTRAFSFRDVARATTAREIDNPFLVGPLIDRVVPHADRGPRVQVRRPDDHLIFDLAFDNLRIEPGGDVAAQLVRTDSARRGILIVEFPPQSFGEEAFLAEQSQLDSTDVAAELPAERDGRPVARLTAGTGTVAKQNAKLDPTPEPLTGRLPSGVRMSGPSRVAFRMPDQVDALPFTLAAVLAAMRDWPMNLDLGARGDETYFDPTWLVTEVAQRLNDAIVAHLGSDEGPDAGRALAEGARRIADLAAGGLSGGAPAPVAWDALRAEAASLFDRHPRLRDGDLHTATLATLAAGSAGRLAAMAAAGGALEGVVDAGALPYLPLLADLPHKPAASVTALELPYRLHLTPIGAPRWRHADDLATARGRTELWHTRLGDPAPEHGREGPSRFRLLWSPDLDSAADPTRPFRMSLDRQDRDFLVKLTADWTQMRAGGRRRYLPQSAEAKRLHLSALGALFDAGGDWEPRPEGVDLEQWRHIATLGRDHYVRVVYSGFLLCFGHPASLVKVTERKFSAVDAARPHERVAVPRQRFFLIVRERVRRYDGAAHKHKGRNFPYNEVEILTRVTPNLVDPADPACAPDAAQSAIFGASGVPVTPRMAFWPMIPGAGNFQFDVAATDRDGRRTVFSMPLMFVSEIVNRNLSAPVLTAYNAAPAARRRADLGGASVRFDPAPGQSHLPVSAMSFAVGEASAASDLHVRLHPEMDVAEVRVPALQTLLGRNDTLAMRYPVAVRDGLANAGEIFLAVAGAPYDLEFGGGGAAQTDALGGLAAPQMAIFGLSKRSGPVAGKAGLGAEAALAKAIGNQFDPADFFPLDAALIGGITLRAIIDPALSALDAAIAPKMLQREFPDRVEASFAWDTTVTRSDAAGLMVPRADEVNDTPLTLSGKVTLFLDPSRPAEREAHAALANFKLNLFGCVILWFRRLTFDALPGQKPVVGVELAPGDDGVRFGGPLEFVNDLRKLIPSTGFSDSAGISVTPSGIAAGYSLALPEIGVGIFTLSNVSLGAGFSLPFDNRPVSVRFNFAERQSPFSLTVSLLGGGGFFAIAVGAKGVQEIEAALEFGAAIALNLVVASGTVEIKAGVYFNWKDDGVSPKRVVLAGYVRIHGELTVVAIFSASLTFNLQLAYEKVGDASIVYGEAELIVEVEVLMLSFDVAVRCRRDFAGGKADPRFLDLIPDRSTWDEYCAAFAAEAA